MFQRGSRADDWDVDLQDVATLIGILMGDFYRPLYSRDPKYRQSCQDVDADPEVNLDVANHCDTSDVMMQSITTPVFDFKLKGML